MRLPVHSYRRGGATARMVNTFIEASPPDAKSPATLYRAPGVRSWVTLPEGKGRGLHVSGSALYAVAGTTLYRVSPSYEALGTIAGSGRVKMADNGTTLIIVAGGNTYSTDGTTAPALIADADFPGANSVQFVDGYFTFTEPDSGRFFCSDLYSTDFDALKFATAEGMPDDLVTHLVDHRQLILFGEQSTEIWWNSGADNFPFERAPNGFLEIGCRGGEAKLDNSVIWVADDNTVRRLEGITPVRVSTHAVDAAIRSYASKPYAFTYELEGHLVYVLQFDEGTWAYDVTTNEWHERETYRDNTTNPWRVVDSANLDGVNYVQDLYTGSVGILDPDLNQEWGATMRAEWTYPAVYRDNDRIFHRLLELICETGGAVDIVLSISDDGGKTWRNTATRTLGATGKYEHRIRWHRLGTSRNRVYRMLVSGDAPIRVQDTIIHAA